MMSDGGQSWWTVVGWPAFAASVPGAIAVFQWWKTRQDKREVRTQTAYERREAAQLADQARISKEQSELYQRLEDELERVLNEKERLRAQRRELERDRDRGWDLARWWNDRAHQIRHIARHAQQLAQGYAEHQGVTLPEWEDTSLCALEDPIPSKDAPEGKA